MKVEVFAHQYEIKHRGGRNPSPACLVKQFKHNLTHRDLFEMVNMGRLEIDGFHFRMKYIDEKGRIHAEKALENPSREAIKKFLAKGWLKATKPVWKKFNHDLFE